MKNVRPIQKTIKPIFIFQSKKITLLFAFFIIGVGVMFGNNSDLKRKVSKTPSFESIKDFYTSNNATTSFAMMTNVDDCNVSTTHVGGRVFFDYNSNGIWEDNATLNEGGAEHVEVKVYDASNTLVGIDTTDGSGGWSIDVGNGVSVRVEYYLPEYMEAASLSGGGSSSTVAFATAPQCDVNLGVLIPVEYMGEDPEIVTICNVKYWDTDDMSIVSTDEDSGGNSTTDINDYLDTNHPIAVPINQAGTTWGLAYNKPDKILYTGAKYMVETVIGTSGTGAIYYMDNSTNTGANNTVTTVSLLTTIVNTGTDPSNGEGWTSGPGGSRFADCFDKTDKVGLGDLDVNYAGDTLYTINLNERTLVEIPLSADGKSVSGTVNTYSMPSPASCSGDVIRPFGLKYYQGKVYVGMVCTGENTQDSLKLRGYVYTYTPGDAALSSTAALDFPLSYTRGRSGCGPTKDNPAEWQPWKNVWDVANPIPLWHYKEDFTQVDYPQPILSDIEFEKGDMIIGILDRFGNQVSYINDGNDPSGYTGNGLSTITAGDVLRAGYNGGGTWTIESNATVVGEYSGTTTTAGATTGEGPDDGEFYFEESYACHDEILLGGMSQIPGRKDIVINAYDPSSPYLNYSTTPQQTRYGSGGLVWLDNDNGSYTKGWEGYYWTYNGANFSKGNGFGDVEYFTMEEAPLEIGNIVWVDVNENGIQDVGEAGLSNIIITLYNSVGEIVAIDTTDANGNYLFDDAKIAEYTLQGDTEVAQNANYYLVLSGTTDAPFSTTDELLISYSGTYTMTLADQVLAGHTNADILDSDGKIGDNAGAGDPLFTNGFPFISVTTSTAGSAEHTADFGFVSENMILPINDDEVTLENVSVSGNILTNDFDPENNNIALTGIEDPATPGTYINSGTIVTIPGTDETGSPVTDAGDLTINTDGTYTFIPANNFTGVVVLPYQIIDDHASPASEDATLTIIVTGVPDVTATGENITVAIDDEKVTYVNVPVSGNVLLNDADPTFDTQTFTGFDDGSTPVNYVNSGALNDVAGKDFEGNNVINAGDFVIGTDGSYTFTPEAGFTGTVETSYEVCDDGTPQECAVATLVITVLPDAITDNDKPFAGDDFSTTVLNTPITGDFISNDNDPNTNSVSFMGTTINPAVGTSTSIGTYPTQEGGTIEIFDDGSYIYTPAAGYSGPDNFKYEVCDVTATMPQPLCDSATINMTVFPLYRDFSDLDNSVYTPAYNWAGPDANSDNVPDATDAFWLGEKVDYEIADLTSPMGNGDDTNGINDDDGLITPTSLPVGMTETFTTVVNSNKVGTVHFGLWIDWDGNGTFEDFYPSSGVTDGVTFTNVNTTINVPAAYAGGDVYIRQRAFNSAPTSADFGGDFMNGEVEDYVLSFTALPVELTDFQGKIDDCNAKLFWETASEENFNLFSLERSVEGIEFISVAKVHGKGGISSNQYIVEDEIPRTSKVFYYRLKMFDNDGSFEYSSVIVLETDCIKVDEVMIYPNPISKNVGMINIEFPSIRGEAIFSIFDAKGVAVKVISVETESGWNKMSFDISDLPHGIYSIVRNGNDNLRVIEQFIIEE